MSAGKMPELPDPVYHVRLGQSLTGDPPAAVPLFRGNQMHAYARTHAAAVAGPLAEALGRCIGSLRTVSPGGDGDPDIEFARAALAAYKESQK